MVEHIPEELFERVVIPVASEADARTARESILPYLDQVGGVGILTHVITIAENDIDPSPPSMQAEDAEELFAVVCREFDERIVETRKIRGADTAASIFEVAHDTDASAIVFSPREKSWLIRFLTGDTARSLVTNPEVPVIALPRRTE